MTTKLPPLKPLGHARSHSPRELFSQRTTARSHMPMYSHRTDITGPYNSARIQKLVQRSLVVDFSYMDITDTVKITTEVPRSGKVWREKRLTELPPLNETQQEAEAREAKLRKKNGEKPEPAKQLFFKDRDRANDLIVVKAGNEQYGFKMNRAAGISKVDHVAHRLVLNDKGEIVEMPEYEAVLTRNKNNQVVSQTLPKQEKYWCNILRLNNNSIGPEGINFITKAVDIVLYKPFTQLTTLDLSFNNIAALPANLHELPLVTLLLHHNNLRSMDSIEVLNGCSSLQKLTLFGNPVQENTKRYKYAVMSLIPWLLHLDGALLSPKDWENLEVYERLFIAKFRSKNNRSAPI